LDHLELQKIIQILLRRTINIENLSKLIVKQLLTLLYIYGTLRKSTIHYQSSIGSKRFLQICLQYKVFHTNGGLETGGNPENIPVNVISIDI
jgi:hypothetical protein